MNIRKIEFMAMLIGISAFIVMVSSILIGAQNDQPNVARHIKWFAFPAATVMGMCSVVPMALRFYHDKRESLSGKQSGLVVNKQNKKNRRQA